MFLFAGNLIAEAAGSKVGWQLDCRGRWVKSDAGNSIAGAAGSKVTLATRLPRPLAQKCAGNSIAEAAGSKVRRQLDCRAAGSKVGWQLDCRGRWVKSAPATLVTRAAGSKVMLATPVAGRHSIDRTSSTGQPQKGRKKKGEGYAAKHGLPPPPFEYSRNDIGVLIIQLPEPLRPRHFHALRPRRRSSVLRRRSVRHASSSRRKPRRSSGSSLLRSRRSVRRP